MTPCIEVKTTPRHRYGSVRIGSKNMGAHRAAWMKAHGPIPPGMCVMHRCDNPACVNLEHLQLGTMADNIRDRYAKGRNGTVGEKARTAKLTWEAVHEIRNGLFGVYPLHAIAIRYGVSPQTIMRVGTHTTWKRTPSTTRIEPQWSNKKPNQKNAAQLRIALGFQGRP